MMKKNLLIFLSLIFVSACSSQVSTSAVDGRIMSVSEQALVRAQAAAHKSALDREKVELDNSMKRLDNKLREIKALDSSGSSAPRCTQCSADNLMEKYLY